MLEIGKIYEGKVKGIKEYGAFVDVLNEDGQMESGMVHISEVANTYVSDIREHLTEGQEVKVKVLQINEQGKISMSIKKAAPPAEGNGQKPFRRQPQQQRGERREKPIVWEPKPQKPESEMTFEDMMSKFKQNSEERMCDIKRNTDRKNGSRRKK